MKKTRYSSLFILFIFGYSFVFGQKLAEKEQLIEGNIQYERKNFKEAQNAYQKALSVNNKSLKGQYNLGNTFYNQTNNKEAIKQYHLASKLAKDKQEKSSVFHNLGNAHMKQKEYQSALNAYRNSLKNNPLDNQTRYNFALAKKMLEEQEDKKPKEQKEKEKEQKEQQKKEREKKQESKQTKQEEKDNAKEKDNGDKKKGQEKNNSQDNKNSKPQIDSKLSEGILNAIERQERQTHKRIVEEQRNTTTETNKKDW